MLGQLYEQSWKMIISPPKIPHRITSLGPKEQMIQGKRVLRVDFTVSGDNMTNLSGILFYSPDIPNQDLVLYLHGNGGSKVQSLDFLKCIPRQQFAVAAFDFAGCGNSGEGYLTYGICEIHDVKRILQQVKKHINYKKLTLWGRSMGAVTSILYAELYQNQVSSLVLDVPFRTLDGVIKKTAYQQSSMPRPILNMFLYFIKKKCQQQTQFQLFSIDYLQAFKRIHQGISILFIYSRYDKIVPAQQVFQFYNIFSGKKQICQIYQDHDQDRKEQIFLQGIKWIKRWNGTPNLNFKRVQNLIQSQDMTVSKENCNCKF